MPKGRKKKGKPVFRPLSPVTRSQCRRLEEEEIYGQIMTIAENAETPLSPSVIHERLGGPDVCSFWDVRRCLSNMQDKQIMNNIDDGSWILHEKYDALEENNNEAQAEDHVHINDTICTEKSTENKVPELQKEIPNLPYEDHTPGNEDCVCPNAGDRCRHFHQHWTVNNYIQKGNGNRMFTGPRADFNYTFRRPFSTV